MRHGRPVVVVIAPEARRSRRTDAVFAEAESIRVLLDDAKDASIRDAWISAERAEDLVNEVRESRRRN